MWEEFNITHAVKENEIHRVKVLWVANCDKSTH